MAKEKKEKEPKPEGEAGEEVEGGKKKSKKKLIIIVVVVLLIGGVGGGLTMGGGKPKKAADGKPKPTTTVTYPEVGVATLDKVTTTLSDNTLVQFDLGVRIVNKKLDKGEKPPLFLGAEGFKAEEFKANDGVIARAAASTAISKFSHEELLTHEGMEKGREAIEHAVKESFHGFIDEVFVVGFILQT